MKFWLLLLEGVSNFCLLQWRVVEILNSIFLISSDISPVINNGHCLNWLMSGHQSGNPFRESIPEAIFILPGKYKRFTFVPPVIVHWNFLSLCGHQKRM